MPHIKAPLFYGNHHVITLARIHCIAKLKFFKHWMFSKDDGMLRQMTTEKLLKALPILQKQLDALVQFDVILEPIQSLLNF